MTKPLQFSLLLMILLWVSCQKKISDLEFEKNVMTEIFPSLIDSTCIDSRLFLSFPPEYGESIFDKTGHYIGVDSTKATIDQKRKLAEWKTSIDKIKKDTSEIIVAFNPKIEKNTQEVSKDFENHFKGVKIFKPKKESDSVYVLHFENIKLKNKIRLKNISEFPKGRGEIWLKKYDFVFSGAVFFTGIQFDKDKKFGILDGGFACGRLCGNGFRIYIKKVNNKWIIDKIEDTWVS